MTLNRHVLHSILGNGSSNLLPLYASLGNCDGGSNLTLCCYAPRSSLRSNSPNTSNLPLPRHASLGNCGPDSSRLPGQVLSASLGNRYPSVISAIRHISGCRRSAAERGCAGSRSEAWKVQVIHAYRNCERVVLKLEFVDGQVIGIASTHSAIGSAAARNGEQRITGLAWPELELRIGLVSAVDPHALKFPRIASRRDVRVSVAVDHHHGPIVICQDEWRIGRVVKLNIHSYDMPAALLAHSHLRYVGLEGPRIEATRPARPRPSTPGLKIVHCALSAIRSLLHSIRKLLDAPLHRLPGLLNRTLHLLPGLLNRAPPLLDGVRSLLNDVLSCLRHVPDFLPEAFLRLRLRLLILLGLLILLALLVLRWI